VGATNGKQRGETLVHAAARSGRGALVDFLVGRGAHAGAVDKDGANAYHVAAGLGHAPLMTHLLEKYPKDFHPSRALPDGRTPLLLAVRSGAPDAVAAVVRFAPTHDVGRCWTEIHARLAKTEGEGEKKRLQDMLDALRTKVCRRRCIALRPTAHAIYRKASCLRARNVRSVRKPLLRPPQQTTSRDSTRANPRRPSNAADSVSGVSTELLFRPCH
jgi:hypothetical protein